MPLVEVTDPRSPEHGDYATNFCLIHAKAFGMNPRQLANVLVLSLLKSEEFESVEVAGPGFINFRLLPKAISRVVGDVMAAGDRLAYSTHPDPQKINVEFVSVNPNGPITVASGRGAAFGSTLCNVLQAAGHEIHREYYINDGVNSTQMQLFAKSVHYYFCQQTGKTGPDGKSTAFPEKGYKGDYVQLVSETIIDDEAKNATLDEIAKQPITWWQERSQHYMLERQRFDLAAFGVNFDTWFSEQSLHEKGEVDRCIQELTAKGVADEEPYRTILKMGKKGEIQEVNKEEQAVETDEDDPNAVGEETPPNSPSSLAPRPSSLNTLWLRSTKFGDDMDRVLRRKDGRLTYIASDVAYHKDKFKRPENADKLITVLGPDHHGYIGRLQAVVGALLEQEPPTVDGSEPLNEIEEKIYRSTKERDACQSALGEAKKRLEVVIFQIVRFVKEGKIAPMHKRDGNIYALIDLIDEIGKTMAPDAPQDKQREIGRDVSRFFYLMRSHDTHMDFDLDLATKQNDENPVFYVQYAHARICSVMRKAAETDIEINSEAPVNLALLVHPKELALIKKIADLPYEVRRCADDYAVHRLTTYAVELARIYHGFYDNCRVILPEQPELSRARMKLCEATALTIKATLSLLGISAPESM
jgi:arginyl-tRNA synthetase